MKRVTVCFLAAAAALLWAGVARAERESEYASPAPGGASKVPPRATPSRPNMFAPASAAFAKPMSQEQRDERRFLKEAAAANRFESDASRLALAKSNDPRLRAFASNLINHHDSVANELQHMLHGRGMAPPMLGNHQRKTLNRLAKLNGAKFDREYLEEVALKHQQEDVAFYEKASLATRDPILKAWIERNLPTLQNHLATAESLVAPKPKLVRSPAPRADGTSPHLARVAAVPPRSRMGTAGQPPATRSMGAAPAQLGPDHPAGAPPNEASIR